MWPDPHETFTEEILNGQLHFLCSVISSINPSDNTDRNMFYQPGNPIIPIMHLFLALVIP